MFSSAQCIQGPAISVAFAGRWLNALDTQFSMRVYELCMREMTTLNNHFPVARYKHIMCLSHLHN